MPQLLLFFKCLITLFIVSSVKFWSDIEFGEWYNDDIPTSNSSSGWAFNLRKCSFKVSKSGFSEFCDIVCPFNKFQYSFELEDLRFFFGRSDLYSLKDLLIFFLYAMLAFCIDIKCSVVWYFIYFLLLFWYIFPLSSHDLINQDCNGCWCALLNFLLCLSEVTTPASDAASFKDVHIYLWLHHLSYFGLLLC